jgi:NADH-ubiquinone oxidoreductase chain 2
VYEENVNINATKERLSDENNSPVQLISQMKGYFYMNPFISMSLTVTLLSFIGVPPIAGFFAKQMVLSAALDRGQVFLVIVAILTSVIAAAYYLNLIKQIFFYKNDYKVNPSINNATLTAYVVGGNESNERGGNSKAIKFTPQDITINGALSSSISVMTLLLSLFMFIPEE